jgi:hypothetical protein
MSRNGPFQSGSALMREPAPDFKIAVPLPGGSAGAVSVAVPLAFLLAAAAAHSAVARAENSPATQPDEACRQAEKPVLPRLDKLLDLSGPHCKAVVDPATHIVQWYNWGNWPNCFSGYWRNC